MRIILLSGEPGTGKTTTLRDCLYCRFESLKARDITEKYDYDNDDPDDYVVEYKGKTVAVRVDGDLYHQWCIDALVRYAVCDFLILACREFKRSLAELVEKHIPQCHHKVIKKKEACDSDNKGVCDEIIKYLDCKIAEDLSA